MSLMRIHLCRFLPGFFPFSVVYYTYIKGGNCPLLKNIFKEATMAAKTIGIFDIIGPNMIGPSSSHTAGALRIALLAAEIRAPPTMAGSAPTARAMGMMMGKETVAMAQGLAVAKDRAASTRKVITGNRGPRGA